MVNKINIQILIILLFIVDALFASVYTPLDTANYTKRKSIATSYLKTNKTFSKTLTSQFSGAELSYVKKMFQDSKKTMHSEILHGDYIFNDSIDSLVNYTAKKLIIGNLAISDKAKFFISRNISLNALSMADKTFIINLGSFYYLENQSQFAALLAHEFAHTVLYHHFQSLHKNYSMIKNDARSSMNEIKKSKYGRGTKALEQFKQMMYTNGKLVRNQEFEADSLGYVIYRNAGLKPTEFLNAFRLMLEYDTVRPKELDRNIYKKVFDLPDQKFKDEWLKMEDFSGYDYTKYQDKFNSDSIKSHPEITERISKLETIFPELKQSEKPDSADIYYAKIQHLAAFERFASLDFDEQYGFGVYLCLVKLAQPGRTVDEISYYQQWLGKYFSKMCKARKEYTLNRYLDRVDPKNQSISYQQFLNFMWNLKVNEIETIANYYTKKDS